MKKYSEPESYNPKGSDNQLPKEAEKKRLPSKIPLEKIRKERNKNSGYAWDE